MLLLDYQNVLIQSLLTERFSGAPPVSIDQVVSDFDGVTFHLSTPESKTKILISINVRCFKELVQYGAQQVLEREYGEYIVAPESGYDFSILIDLENLPSDAESKEDLVRRAALMKRNAMAAPFERAFDDFTQRQEEASKFTRESAPEGVREGGEVMAIHYRDEEAIYIKASHDRVTVIFSTIFREETDRIFGKVFLQEFVDARRRAIQNAPQVLFRNEPPLELQDVRGLSDGSNGEVGYVTFVLFPRHLTPQRRHETISHIQTFRDYFHYHIKASKAYIHSRMRRRTADFLQVLNRARPENEEKERKTASGRTFRVQGVGDSDNFRLFHTPGGRLTGWGILPWRRVPDTKKGLQDNTIQIRLAGIDAPEMAHFGKPAQPFSKEAYDFLTSYVLHRRVRAYVHKRDQYDRAVATVYVRRWLMRRDVGLEMLKRGLATVYEAKSGAEYGGMEEKYRKTEMWAKKLRKGMWRGNRKDYESPMDYKKRVK
ncbi:MAG: hypothetical protein Q9174_002818 [Haloplaca sp. 1 TL-2023]